MCGGGGIWSLLLGLAPDTSHRTGHQFITTVLRNKVNNYVYPHLQEILNNQVTSLAFLWTVRGSLRTPREPVQAWREHANPAQNDPDPIGNRAQGIFLNNNATQERPNKELDGTVEW